MYLPLQAMFTYFVLLVILIAFESILILRKIERASKESNKDHQYIKQRLTKAKTRSLLLKKEIQRLKKLTETIW